MNSVSTTNISDHDFGRPSGTGTSLHRYPGTSCLATISLSLRDKLQPVPPGQKPFARRSTHGFFAKEDPTATQTEAEASLNDRQIVSKSKFFKNPMHRSGLALAGAQTTIGAWERGEVPPQARPKHSLDCTCIHDTAGSYSALPNALVNR